MWNGCEDLNCGNCDDGYTCNEWGKCVQNLSKKKCFPSKTCESLNYTCGFILNECGIQQECGSCYYNESCIHGVCSSMIKFAFN